MKFISIFLISMGVSFYSWASSNCMDDSTVTNLSHGSNIEIRFTKIQQGHLDDYHDNSLEFEFRTIIKGYNLVSVEEKNGKIATSMVNLPPEFGGVEPIVITEQSFSVQEKPMNERLVESQLNHIDTVLLPLSEIHFELARIPNARFAKISLELEETNYFSDDIEFNSIVLPLSLIRESSRELSQGKKFLLTFNALGTSKVIAELSLKCN